MTFVDKIMAAARRLSPEIEDKSARGRGGGETARLERLATHLGISFHSLKRWRYGRNEPSPSTKTLVERQLDQILSS